MEWKKEIDFESEKLKYTIVRQAISEISFEGSQGPTSRCCAIEEEGKEEE
jgi:hypothetical protein